MGRLAQTDGLTEIQRDILATVRDFVDKEIIPVATELEHNDEYPAQIVEGMKRLGLFGLTIPEEYGGLGESLLTYALLVEEIARGWMSVRPAVWARRAMAYFSCCLSSGRPGCSPPRSLMYVSVGTITLRRNTHTRLPSCL